jgi:ABC-type multidrug transport system fused ATPase/permease subunit
MWVDPSTSFFSQTPWIYNDTRSGNILFDSRYDSDRCNAVFDLCCLREALRVLCSGDETAISERGVNLSGGQKAHVAVAWCIYTASDMFVLDDPLSAVEAEVGMKLLDECIVSELKLRYGRARRLRVPRKAEDREAVPDRGITAPDHGE